MRYEILDAAGAVINTIEADESFCSANFASFRQVPETPIVSPKRTLTKLEYMNRFTETELAAIYTAAKTVVSIEIWLEKFKLATEINLDDAEMVSGLQAMEAAGLISAGRAAEILA